MNKKELLTTLEAFGMRPGKILGQNFLIDNNLLDFIVRTAEPAKGEVILEAGPGFGALTRPLLEAAPRYTLLNLTGVCANICVPILQNRIFIWSKATPAGWISPRLFPKGKNSGP